MSEEAKPITIQEFDDLIAQRDLDLMEKLEVKSTVGDKETVVVQPTQADATGETDDGFTGKAVEIKSTTGD